MGALPQLVLKTIHAFLIVGLFAVLVAAVWFMVPHEPRGPALLRIERDDGEGDSVPLDEATLADCPAFARALQKAALGGNATLLKRRDIRCAEATIEATFGPDWDHYMRASWHGSVFRFLPYLA